MEALIADPVLRLKWVEHNINIQQLAYFKRTAADRQARLQRACDLDSAVPPIEDFVQTMPAMQRNLHCANTLAHKIKRVANSLLRR